MPETSLHINLTEGIIEASGDTAFVKQIYADFKDRLGEAFGGNEEESDIDEDEEEEAPRAKAKRR